MAADSKRFYGSVTVGERGQIVIPAEARRDFRIQAGDKLLVFGDHEQGIALGTLAMMAKIMAGTMDLFRQIQSTVTPDSESEDEGS